MDPRLRANTLLDEFRLYKHPNIEDLSATLTKYSN